MVKYKVLNNALSVSSDGHLKPIDGWYGPWRSFKELFCAVIEVDDPSEVEDDEVNDWLSDIEPGLTIALIDESGSVVEYWKPSDKVGDSYPQGGENGGFVIKSPNVEVSGSAIDKAVSDYLTEHPVTGVTDEQVENAVNEYLDEKPASVTPNKDGAGLLPYLAA